MYGYSCAYSSQYITLFRLTGQHSHNTQYNRTLKQEKKDTVNAEHTHTQTHTIKKLLKYNQ